MAKDRLSGKLAVILHADVAASTQLVQQDEQLAHERIQDAFRHFSDTIGKYHGRVQELRGDALLAEFERASDAVTAALAFQSNHTNHLEEIDDGIQPEIRVGIALGEVVIADSTVTGAGVVLAQRIEQLAEPGGLCITSAIHEALPNRMPFSFESLGEQALKGFDNNVKVYRVQLSGGESVPPPQRKSKGRVTLKNWWQRVAFVSVLVLVASGIGYWTKASLLQEEPALAKPLAFAFPNKPSLVVLPFINISNDKEQEYFADGMTDDLLTGLSKLPALFLISRNTSFTYKNKSIKVREIAEELGVRFVMEGSVRRSGNIVRINVQLIDALSGGHIWAEKYDGDMADIFKLQDDVVAKIVYSLDQRITPQKTVAETNVPEAYDLFLQGLKHSYVLDPENMAKAISLFKKAIELDANYYRAHALLAHSYGWVIDAEWESELNMDYHQVRKLMTESLELALKKPTSTAYRVSAWMLFWDSEYRKALEEIEKAIVLNPNDPYIYNMKASILARTGPAKEAEENALYAIRLNPKNAGTHFRQLGKGLFHQDRFIEAADAFERAAKLDPNYEMNYLFIVTTYGHLGNLQKAKAALDKFENIRSGRGHKQLTVSEISGWDIYYLDAHRERYLRGFRLAGMPEN
jgi:adenylate cyclase